MFFFLLGGVTALAGPRRIPDLACSAAPAESAASMMRSENIVIPSLSFVSSPQPDSFVLLWLPPSSANYDQIAIRALIGPAEDIRSSSRKCGMHSIRPSVHIPLSFLLGSLGSDKNVGLFFSFSLYYLAATGAEPVDHVTVKDVGNRKLGAAALFLSSDLLLLIFLVFSILIRK
jgi:hypothetical protein